MSLTFICKSMSFRSLLTFRIIFFHARNSFFLFSLSYTAAHNLVAYSPDIDDSYRRVAAQMVAQLCDEHVQTAMCASALPSSPVGMGAGVTGTAERSQLVVTVTKGGSHHALVPKYAVRNFPSGRYDDPCDVEGHAHDKHAHCGAYHDVVLCFFFHKSVILGSECCRDCELHLLEYPVILHVEGSDEVEGLRHER